MKGGHEASYGGLPLKLECIDEQTKKALGKVPLEDQCTSQTLQQAKAKGLNARQIMAEIKGSFGDGGNPTFPIGVEGLPPARVNAYSDRGATMPKHPAVGLGRIWSLVATPSERHTVPRTNARGGICKPGRS